MTGFWHDIRHAARTLAARPGYAVTAIVTVALGLGATTAVLSVVYTVVLAPPPYPEPERLVEVARLVDGRRLPLLPAPQVRALLDATTTLGAMGVSRFQDVALSGGGTPERVRGVIVTGPTLGMLGVAPIAGRLPDPADDTPGGACVVVLSHQVWTDHFGSAAEVIGTAARLDGAPCTVVAVMPPGFAFPAPYFAPGDLWLLAGPAGVDWDAAGGAGFLTFGRLAPGADQPAVLAELDVSAARMPATAGGQSAERFVVMRWADSSRDNSRPRLLTLLAAAGLVLVIGCVNLVNLQLARNVDRQAEIATRLALGASRARLIRHLVVENALLFTLGAAAGLAVARWSLDLILRLRSFYIPRMEEAAIDVPTASVCLGLALVAGLLTAVIPAFRLSDVGAAHTLRQAGRGVTPGPRGRRIGRALVSVETALALVLVTGAALLLRSYRQTAAIDPGFRTSALLHARVTPPPGRYQDKRDLTAFYREIEDGVAGLPGVADVALTSVPPGVGHGGRERFALAGAAPAPGAWPQTVWRAVGDRYFAALGIAMVRGDGFERRRAERRVAVVNEQFVRQFLPDRDPIGVRLHLVSSARAAAPEPDAWTIIGVAADAREEFTSLPAPPAVYVRYADQPPPSMAILAHTTVAPLSLSRPLRDLVASVDPDQPVFGIRDIEFILAGELDLNRLALVLLTLFASVALALAMAGIYGVVAHVVGQRLREMGVRLALGAQPADVRRLVLDDCVGYALLGVAAGLGAIALLGERLASLTPHWAGTDPGVLVLAAVLILAVAVVAAWLPARRVARVDPVIALRQP